MPVIGTPVGETCTPDPCEPAPCVTDGDVFGGVYGDAAPSAGNAMDNAILQSAVDGISSTSVDGQSMTVHNILHLVEADKYLTTKRMSRGPMGGARFMKLRPPSAL